MPKNEPDSTDPMTLTGVETPAGLEDVVFMAQAFAEEFALSGWAEERILSLYTNPFYAGPHLAYRQLGEERVRRIIAEAVRPWSTNHA